MVNRMDRTLSQANLAPLLKPSAGSANASPINTTTPTYVASLPTAALPLSNAPVDFASLQNRGIKIAQVPEPTPKAEPSKVEEKKAEEKADKSPSELPLTIGKPAYNAILPIKLPDIKLGTTLNPLPVGSVVGGVKIGTPEAKYDQQIKDKIASLVDSGKLPADKADEAYLLAMVATKQGATPLRNGLGKERTGLLNLDTNKFSKAAANDPAKALELFFEGDGAKFQGVAALLTKGIPLGELAKAAGITNSQKAFENALPLLNASLDDNSVATLKDSTLQVATDKTLSKGLAMSEATKAGFRAMHIPPEKVEIMDRVNQELGINPRFLGVALGDLRQEAGPGLPTNSSDGVSVGGLIQWMGPRYDQLERYASKLGKSPQDFETQYRFMLTEDALTNGGMTARGDGSSYKVFRDPNATDAQLHRAMKDLVRYGDAGDRYVFAKQAKELLANSGYAP